MLITNCVALNGGDAAILHALLDRLRAALGPNLEVVIVDDQPADVRRLYPGLDTRPRLDTTLRSMSRLRFVGKIGVALQRSALVFGAWCITHGLATLARVWLSSRQRAALDVFRRCDAVVSTGGTYLVEQYSIDGRLLELQVALAMRRPLVLFTQSLGPFTRRGHRRAVRTIVSRARLVLLRDERSRRHLMDLGLDGAQMQVVADAAFALAPPRVAKVVESGFRVAVSVRDWPYALGDSAAANRTYRTAIAALVDRLVRERGAEITFLSTCQGLPEYWTDDSAVAATIATSLDATVQDSVCVDRGFHGPLELRDLLTGFDLVVATRMHMAILALVAGVPVFAIAYEFKTRELFEGLALAECVCDFDGLGDTSLVDGVNHVLTELPALRSRLQTRVPLERESALGTADMLTQALAPTTSLAPTSPAELPALRAGNPLRSIMRRLSCRQ